MAIYKTDLVSIELNSGSIHRSFLNHSIGSGDTQANQFGVRIVRDGQPVDLTGVSCFGYFRNAEGTNIALTNEGTVNNNEAFVTLPQACYAVEGQFTLAIKLIGGGVTGTMRIIDGMVDNTNTGSPVAPTEDVPTYTEILAVYDQMQETLEDYSETVAEQNGKIEDLEDDLETALAGQDAKIAEISEFINGYINNDVNNKITPSATNEGYWMSSNGSGVEHAGYNIYRFPVTPGNVLLLNVGSSEAPTVWVYKNANAATESANVGECQTTDGIEWTTVPATAQYLFVALPSGNQYSVSAMPIRSNIEILTGPVFMYMANGKINVNAGSTSRIGIDGTYYVGSEWNGSFAVSDNTAHFLCLNTSGWYIRKAPLKPTDEPVAVAYQNRVYADNGNIITNHLPIDNLYQREDIPVFINERRAGYPLKRVLSKIDSFGYFYRLVNCYTVDENVVTLMDSAGRPVAMPNSKMHQNTANISNKKILAIGDSITNRGWWQQRIKDYVPSVDFVGTRDTQHNNLKCEGYSGKNTNNVLRSSTITLINGTTIPNPFWNPATSQIDFAYYCTNNNISPDYVVIEFGLNESNAVAYRENVQFFIDKIRAYSQTVKIYVVQPFNVAKTQATVGQNTVASMQAACDMCTLESSSFTDCVLIPCWYILVDEYDYESDDVEYGIGSVTVPGVADAIHPSEAIGFAKIGDQIYNYLGL